MFEQLAMQVVERSVLQTRFRSGRRHSAMESIVASRNLRHHVGENLREEPSPSARRRRLREHAHLIRVRQ